MLHAIATIRSRAIQSLVRQHFGIVSLSVMYVALYYTTNPDAFVG